MMMIWTKLEQRFRKLHAEAGDSAYACWIETEEGEGDDQWYIMGMNSRQLSKFNALAERAAVELGHNVMPVEEISTEALFKDPLSPGTIFWLNQLKEYSPDFDSGLTLTDGDTSKSSKAGGIHRPINASSEYCYRLATAEIAAQRAKVLAQANEAAVKRKRPTGKRGHPKDPATEVIKRDVRDLKKIGVSYREIWDRLGTRPRPTNAAWRDLPWPAAMRKYPGPVTKWLSSVCRQR